MPPNTSSKPTAVFANTGRPRLLLITMFGLGHMRPFSGTWGSLPPVIVAAVILALAHLTGHAPTTQWAWTPLWWVYHAAIGFMFLLGVAGCIFQGDAAEAWFGEKDPGEAVADETAGQSLSLLFLPGAALASPGHAAIALTSAFVLFRICDIVKPPPANGLQRIPGGWGILLDDLVAGLYAALLVQALTRLL